jgi:AraC-like DNA-binding protein
MVKASAAHGAVEFFARAGLDPDELLRSINLSRGDLQQPGSEMMLAQYCRMFEIAACRSGRSNLGLEFGSAFRPQYLGYIGYLAVTAPTLGRALRCLADAMPSHQQATFMDLIECDDALAAVSYAIADGSVAERRQDAELSIAVVINLFRQALGSRWAPQEVHFTHARPATTRAHDRFFGAPVCFQQDENRVVFFRSALSAPMPHHDPVLHELLAAAIGREKRVRPCSSDLVSCARHHIERLLPQARCSLEEVAAACGVAPWTLKRKLRSQDLSFQQLVTTARRDLALEYLGEQGRPVTEVALALGYSELSAFSRAFRQWTRSTPRDYVRGLRRSGER